MSSLKAVLTVLKVCMGLKKYEKILIVYDKNKKRLANIFLKNAKKLCKKADLMQTSVAKVNGEEPPKLVAESLTRYDVAILLTSRSLSHTNARRSASKKGVRIASMPGITESILNRTLTADYKRIKSTNDKLYKILKKTKKIVLTKKGNRLMLFTNRPFNDSGFYIRKRAFGNLPAGEVGFAPKEGKTNGIFTIDKTIAGIGKLKSPIKITVKDGLAVKIEGGNDAKKLKKLLRRFKDKRVYNIAL